MKTNKDNQANHSEYMTTREAAQLLRVSYGTLKIARGDGTLHGRTGPLFLDVSGPKALRTKIRYRRQDIIDWMESGVERTINAPSTHSESLPA